MTSASSNPSPPKEKEDMSTIDLSDASMADGAQNNNGSLPSYTEYVTSNPPKLELLNNFVMNESFQKNDPPENTSKRKRAAKDLPASETKRNDDRLSTMTLLCVYICGMMLCVFVIMFALMASTMMSGYQYTWNAAYVCPTGWILIDDMCFDSPRDVRTAATARGTYDYAELTCKINSATVVEPDAVRNIFNFVVKTNKNVAETNMTQMTWWLKRNYTYDRCEVVKFESGMQPPMIAPRPTEATTGITPETSSSHASSPATETAAPRNTTTKLEPTSGSSDIHYNIETNDCVNKASILCQKTARVTLLEQYIRMLRLLFSAVLV